MPISIQSDTLYHPGFDCDGLRKILIIEHVIVHIVINHAPCHA